MCSRAVRWGVPGTHGPRLALPVPFHLESRVGERVLGTEVLSLGELLKKQVLGTAAGTCLSGLHGDLGQFLRRKRRER